MHTKENSEMNLKFVKLLAISLAVLVIIDVAAQDQIANLESEVETLNVKFDLLNTLNTKILNTIYFALGGIGALVLAIIGLNFFQNFRLNERKVDSIREELESNFSVDIREAIATLDKKYESTREQIQKESQQINKKLRSELSGEFEELEEELKELGRKVLLLETNIIKDSRPSTHFSNLIEVLDFDIKKDWEFRINDTLEQISKALNTYRPHAEYLSNLQLLLDKLPEDYRYQKEEIQQKMKTRE